MPVVKHCASCDKLFTCNRNHAETCSSTCRGVRWRANKEPFVSVKLAFGVAHFEVIKNAAAASGQSINQHLHDRLTQTMGSSQ
jgi:hypothetical protein